MTAAASRRPAANDPISLLSRLLRARLALLMVAVAGCAPVGAYRGPVPAPGAPQPTAAVPAAGDSAVVLICGDNRPGHLVLSHRYGVSVVRTALREPSPGTVLWGVLNLPIAALQTVLPAFDGVRDVWAQFASHRFTGGNEHGVLQALEANTGVDLLINTGDLVQDGRRGGQWNDFARRHDSLRKRVPFVAVAGNHERTWHPGARDNWDTVVGPPASPGRYWYSLALGDQARFIMLDSNILTDKHDDYPEPLERELVTAQLAWADSALAVPARWKFVVLHHPLVSAGRHMDDWSGPPEHRQLDRRKELLELFRRHNVTAVLAGHEHLYQRVYVTPPAGGTGFWHVTTGGAGSPLYHITERNRRRVLAQSLPDSSRIAYPGRERSVYHYCRLVVRATGAELRVYEVRGNGRTRLIDTVNLGQPLAGS